MIIKGETKTGFKFEIDEEVFDNMELMDEIAAVENDEPQRLGKVAELILGKKGKNALYNHVREENGRVPIEKASNEIFDIFESQSGDDGKNS